MSDSEGFDDMRVDEWPEESPLGPEGCVFPGECCMPGPHYESECHTPEMLLQLEQHHQEEEKRQQ